jgi:septation ring formation regulator EzrA
MQTFIIILSVLLLICVVIVASTVYGLFTDKDKDGIPDALENKFNDVVSDIKNEISKLKK